MYKKYAYVGPKSISYSENLAISKICVQSRTNILEWITQTNQELGYMNSVIATYIIDTEGNLWITDRHCEHVWCASGKNVLGAGEIGFTLEDNDVEVSYVSNQSTGYCPEPSSWQAVCSALKKIRISHPTTFSLELIFRYCTACKQINIVKNEVFLCAVCNERLSAQWNF